LEHIITIFTRLQSETLPTAKEEVQGISLSLTTSETLRLASRYIHSKGYLTDTEIAALKTCYQDLVTIVPQLNKTEKQYFASLRQLAKEVLDTAENKKLPDTEIEKRHKWRRVYNQIKDIVNEADFLGVADVVYDEYDDFNFKIYSQILKSKDESEMYKVIKSFVESDYEITLSDKEINQIIEKVKLIELDTSIS
jgi:hypothetical protein